MTSQEQIIDLARLLIVRHDNAACTACLDGLDEYVSAQLEGRPYQRLYPEIAAHLDSCVDCAESYAILYDAAHMTEAAVVPAPARGPDLGFLAQAAPPPQADGPARLRDTLAASIERHGGRVRFRLTQALLDLIPRSQGPQLSFRAAGEEQNSLFDIEVDEPDTEVSMLHVSAYVNPGADDRCTLRVQLGLQDREWPDLADIPVQLVSSEMRRAGVTDHWGEVVFAEVPRTALAELTIEVDGAAGEN